MRVAHSVLLLECQILYKGIGKLCAIIKDSRLGSSAFAKAARHEYNGECCFMTIA